MRSLPVESPMRSWKTIPVGRPGRFPRQPYDLRIGRLVIGLDPVQHGPGEATQVLVGDPAADPSEVKLLLSHGYRSLLMVPVILRGETRGLVEAMSAKERPWTRMEINRARIVANQLASVIETFFRAAEEEVSERSDV